MDVKIVSTILDLREYIHYETSIEVIFWITQETVRSALNTFIYIRSFYYMYKLEKEDGKKI